MCMNVSEQVGGKERQPERGAREKEREQEREKERAEETDGGRERRRESSDGLVGRTHTSCPAAR